MTDPAQPRPQPVVDLANVGANIVAVVGGLAGIFAALAVATQWGWAEGAAAALTAAATFLAKFVPKLAATGAAAQVTPLEDPRDHLGNELIAETYGKHAARPATGNQSTR